MKDRQLIDRYIELVHREVQANAHKGSVVEWDADAYQIFAEIAYHMAKFNKAVLEVERGNDQAARVQVDEFAADIGVYLAKACQVFGTVNLSE